MAKQVNRKPIRSPKKIVSPFSIYWNKKNFAILFIGLLVIISGYVFMSMGNWDSFPSLFVSPVVLIIGYLVILPVSVLLTGKKENDKSTEEANPVKS